MCKEFGDKNLQFIGHSWYFSLWKHAKQSLFLVCFHALDEIEEAMMLREWTKVSTVWTVGTWLDKKPLETSNLTARLPSKTGFSSCCSKIGSSMQKQSLHSDVHGEITSSNCVPTRWREKYRRIKTVSVEKLL